jgi:hypothetical protein
VALPDLNRRRDLVDYRLPIVGLLVVAGAFGETSFPLGLAADDGKVGGIGEPGDCSAYAPASVLGRLPGWLNWGAWLGISRRR